MDERLSASDWHDRTDLADWRVLQRRVVAGFRAPTYRAAADFVVEIAVVAEAAGHHPDIDLRYPGRVQVTLTTHAVGGLTVRDSGLASVISELARARGCTVEPGAALGVELAVDALDIDAVRPFWKALLAYDDEPVEPGQTVDAIVDPLRIGPAVWFQQMDEPRTQRNRIHVDVIVPHDVADERVAAAVAAGGHVVSAASARAFWVLADPEGNEACVCTWQDRD